MNRKKGISLEILKLPFFVLYNIDSISIVFNSINYHTLNASAIASSSPLRFLPPA